MNGIHSGGFALRRSTLVKLGTLASVVAAIGVAPMAHAADNTYLRIEGIPGQDAATPQTKDAIAVQEFSLGAENEANPASSPSPSGAASQRPAFNELTIKKAVDSTSPVLFQRLVQGTMIPSMELDVIVAQSATAPPTIPMRYCFQNVWVRSQEHSEQAGDDPQENLKFNYGAMAETYATPAGSTVFAGWSVITNSNQLLGGAKPCGNSRIS
jgi:type VI secretion system Hcp family effector